MLQIGDGVVEVKSTSGDTFLGGEDFDQRIVDWLVGKFRDDTGIDLREDRMALQRLKEAAEKAKCEISREEQADVNLPFISADESGPRHLSACLTRTEFEILGVLLRAEGRVLSRRQILGSLHETPAKATERTVDAHVKSIRRKLGDARDCIETVRAAGYRFAGSVPPRAT